MSKSKLNINMSDWSKTKLRGGFIPLPNNKIWSLLKLASKDVQIVFEGVNISAWIYRFPYLSKIDHAVVKPMMSLELLSYEASQKKHGCRHCNAESISLLFLKPGKT